MSDAIIYAILPRGARGLAELRRLLDVPLAAWTPDQLRWAAWLFVMLLRSTYGGTENEKTVATVNLALAALEDLGQELSRRGESHAPESWQKTMRDTIDGGWLVAVELPDSPGSPAQQKRGAN